MAYSWKGANEPHGGIGYASPSEARRGLVGIGTTVAAKARRWEVRSDSRPDARPRSPSTRCLDDGDARTIPCGRGGHRPLAGHDGRRAYDPQPPDLLPL